jgi:hypothetical protein
MRLLAAQSGFFEDKLLYEVKICELHAAIANQLMFENIFFWKGVACLEYSYSG